MKIKLIKATEKAFICSEDNIVCKVNNKFLQIVGYKYEDIVGKSLRELSVLLKINFQIDLENIKGVENVYIFNNNDIPKDVTITYENKIGENKNIYYIKENLNSPLEGILLNFGNNSVNKEEAQAIYSYPELICLKSNKTYIDSLKLMNIKYDNLVGSYHLYPKYLSEIIERGSYHEHDVEHIGSNGIVSYWDINMRLIHGKTNKMFIISSLYDVTDRVIEKNLLEKQRIEMQIILDNISDSINKVNKKGEFTYLNKVARDKLSYYTSDFESLDDKKQFKFFKYNDVNGKELSIEETPVQRVLKGEIITDEIIIETSDLATSYYECNGIPIYDNLGNIDGGVLAYRDIESIFKIEEYCAFRENMEDIYLSYAWISYDDFKIRYINECGLNTIKRSHTYVKSTVDVVGKEFFEFYELDNKNEKTIKNIIKAIEEKASYSHKQRFNTDEKIEYIKTIFYPVYNSKSEVEKIIAVGIDITDEELANEEMNKALKIQEQMLVNVSHELKTPLNLIFSASQLLSIYLEKDSLIDTKKNIIYSNETIMQNCYRLTKLINNILDISKIESGFYELNLTNNNIVEVIENIVDSVSDYTKASGLEIIFNTEIKEMIIAFDTYKIERILLNLISNAIKFSNAKGTILVNLEYKESYIEISVQDDGIGIDKKDLDIIFEKFRQINTSLNRISEGTGIGLSLVKSIVKLHKGEISVESTLGKGSIFRVKLPIITINNENIELDKNYDNNKLEMIKFELSDIYS